MNNIPIMALFTLVTSLPGPDQTVTMALDPAKVHHFLIEQRQRNEAKREARETSSLHH